MKALNQTKEIVWDENEIIPQGQNPWSWFMNKFEGNKEQEENIGKETIMEIDKDFNPPSIIKIGTIVNYLLLTGVTRPAIITHVHTQSLVNLTVFGCESDGAEVWASSALRPLAKVMQGAQPCMWRLP